MRMTSVRKPAHAYISPTSFVDQMREKLARLAASALIAYEPTDRASSPRCGEVVCIRPATAVQAIVFSFSPLTCWWLT